MAISSGAVRAGRAFVEISADNTKFNHALHEAEATFRNFGSQLTQTSAQMLASMSAITAPFALSAKFYAEFDDVMRSVYATAGKIAKVDMNSIFVEGLPFGIGKQARLINLEFKNLTNTARQLGATTSYTAKEAANSMLILARAGFQIAEIQDSVRHILNLARSTGTEISEATQIMIGALRSFNIEARKSEQVVDLLVATANSSPQALSDIGAAMKYIGPVAKSLHLSLRDTLADLGALANFNIKGEQGGTALRNIYLRLASAKNQAKLKETFGVEILDDTGEFRKIVPVLKEIQGKIKETGMSTAEVANSFKEIFGMRSAPAALSLMNADLTRIEEALESVTNLAEDQAHMMDEGLGGAIRMLISRFQELQIAMVNAFSGPVKVAVKGITYAFRIVAAAIENNKGLIKGITYVVGTIGLVTAGFGAMSLAIGVATRSTSSFMTQLRKLSLLQPTRWFDSALVKGKAEKIGTTDIQIKEVDKAREATRYLQENVSGLSKQVVNAIARFNRLAVSFDKIAGKADGFKKAMLKMAEYAIVLNGNSRPLERTFEQIVNVTKKMTVGFNGSRAAMNRNSQAANRLNGSFNALNSAMRSLEKIFANFERSVNLVIQVLIEFRNQTLSVVNEVKSLNSAVKDLSQKLKSIEKAGNSINTAFQKVASRINSATAALNSFNTAINSISEKKSLDVWDIIKDKVGELTGSFKSLAVAVRLVVDALKKFNSLGGKLDNILNKINEAFTSKMDPKTRDRLLDAYEQEQARKKEAKEKSASKPKEPRERKEKDVKEEKLNISNENLMKLFDNVVALNAALEMLRKGVGTLRVIAKSINIVFRSIYNSVSKTNTLVLDLVTNIASLEGQMTKFVNNVNMLKTDFDNLTKSIKNTIRETRNTVTNLRTVKESLRSLSIGKMLRETEKLGKSMVLLGDSMKYIVINRVQVESAIVGIGSSFEKAAVGAMTFSQAIKDVVKGLTSLPKLAAIEKKLAGTEIGKHFGVRGKPQEKEGPKQYTREQMYSLEHKVQRDSTRTLPTYNDNIEFVRSSGRGKSMSAHRNSIAKKETNVADAETALDELREMDANYEATQKLNRAVNGILSAQESYETFGAQNQQRLAIDKSNSEAWNREVSQLQTTIKNFRGDSAKGTAGVSATVQKEVHGYIDEIQNKIADYEGAVTYVRKYKDDISQYNDSITTYEDSIKNQEELIRQVEDELLKAEPKRKGGLTAKKNRLIKGRDTLVADMNSLIADRDKAIAERDSWQARAESYDINTLRSAESQMSSFGRDMRGGNLILGEKQLSVDEIRNIGIDEQRLYAVSSQYAKDYYDALMRGEKGSPYSITSMDRVESHIGNRQAGIEIADKSSNSILEELKRRRQARDNAVDSFLFDEYVPDRKVNGKLDEVVRGARSERIRTVMEKNLGIYQDLESQLVKAGVADTDQMLQTLRTNITRLQTSIASSGKLITSNSHYNDQAFIEGKNSIYDQWNTQYANGRVINGKTVSLSAPLEMLPAAVDMTAVEKRNNSLRQMVEKNLSIWRDLESQMVQKGVSDQDIMLRDVRDKIKLHERNLANDLDFYKTNYKAQSDVDRINRAFSRWTSFDAGGYTFHPKENFALMPDVVNPNMITTYKGLEDAGYLTPQQAPGMQWTDEQYKKGNLRDQIYEQRRSELATARANLRTEQSRMVVLDEMNPVLGSNGTLEELNKAQESHSKLQNRIKELEVLGAKQGLTAEQEAEYWDKKVQLYDAEKKLQQKFDANEKAIDKARQDIVKKLTNTKQYKDVLTAQSKLEQYEKDLAQAEEDYKQGKITKKQLGIAKGNRTRAKKTLRDKRQAYMDVRDQFFGYKGFEDEVKRSNEDVKLAEKALKNAQDWKEAIEQQQQANKTVLEAAKKAKEDAEETIKNITESSQDGNLSAADQAKYDLAEKAKEEAEEKIKEARQQQRRDARSQKKADARIKAERSNLHEARQHQATVATAFRMYGPAMPGNPAHFQNKELAKSQAYYNAAKSQFINNESWKNFFTKAKMFKQNMVDMGKYLGIVVKSFRKTGKEAGDASIRLRAAAAGFNILNFCATTFAAITSMIAQMLGMAAIMAIVTAIISLLTFIFTSVKDLFTMTKEERAEQKREEGRQKFNEKSEKYTERVEKEKEKKEANDERYDRLRELAKKETLTEQESQEAEKLSRQLSPDNGKPIYRPHISLADNGKLVYDNTIDKEYVNQLKNDSKKQLQLEILNKITRVADKSPLIGLFASSVDEKRSGYLQRFLEVSEEDIEELRKTGVLDSAEAQYALQDAINEIKDEKQKAAIAHGLGKTLGYATAGLISGGDDNIYQENQRRLNKVLDNLTSLQNNQSLNGSIFDVDSLIEAQQPFEADLNEALSRNKLNVEEVSEAYTAYIDKLSADLETIQENFDSHSNKTQMNEAQDEIKSKLDKTYKAYLAVNDALIEELESNLPAYGADADIRKALDDSAKGIDNFEKVRKEKINLMKNRKTTELTQSTLEINEQYKKYQTRAEINSDIDKLISRIPEGVDEENRKELIAAYEQQRTKRIAEFNAAFFGEDNTQHIDSEEEFVKQKREERDKKLADIKTQIEESQKTEEANINSDYDSKIASVFNVFQSSLQQSLNKAIEQSSTGMRATMVKAQSTRVARLQSLDDAVNFKVAQDFAQRTYDLKYNSKDIDPEEKQRLKENLEKEKATRRTEYLNSDEYKRNVDAINEEYKEAISPEKLLASISTFQDVFVNEEEQKKNIKKGIQDWHEALAENAVKDLQEQLDAENAKNPNEQNAETIASLNEQIKTKRDEAYKDTQRLANELEQDITKNLEKQTTAELYSRQYAQNRFQLGKANQIARQLDTDNLDQMIKTQQRIKDEAAEGSDEFNAAVSRLAELNVLKSMAEEFNKAAEQMEALKAEYARRQYDFGLKHFGLKDDALTLEEEHKTKLAEMDKEFQERFDAAETPEDKNQLKENYEAYKDFVNKQFEFKKANFANDDLVNPFKKKASEITTKYQDKILQSLVANGFGLDDIVMDQQGNLKAKEGAAKEVQSIIDLGERERDREIDALKNDFSHPFQQKAKEITKSYQDKILEALDANGLSRDVIKFDEEGNVKTQNATARRIADMMEALRNSEIEAQKDDFTDPTKKKVAEIKATWQKDIIEALDANGIKHVWVDPKTGKISAGANAKGNALIRIGEATRDAQIAATEFENKKKQRDYEVKSNAYQTTKPIINEIEVAIANLEVMSTGNQQVDQALELEIKQLQYNKAVLEARQFDERLVELQQLEADALKIWKAATARGANQEEVQKAFERYASLADEVQSTRTSMIDAFREVATSRKDFQQAMNQATNTVEKQSSGTFKAVEAARNSGNWRRENAIKQTFLLKQIADNTSYVDIV